MEEDIQNYSQTVMFRGTPCNSKVQRVLLWIRTGTKLRGTWSYVSGPFNIFIFRTLLTWFSRILNAVVYRVMDTGIGVKMNTLTAQLKKTTLV